jgi:AraC family transcriptional regulator
MELQFSGTPANRVDILRDLIDSEQESSPKSRFLEALRFALQVHEESESLSGEEARVSMAPFRLRRAKEYLEANLCSDLRLQELARAAGLSPFYFCRQFKRSTGLSPIRYALERRIEKAKQLIAGSDRPLVDISLELGFSSQSHFTAIFRKHTGTTPRRYRERQAHHLARG